MLSHKQARLLRYIETYIAAHTVSPTYRQMADFMGAASPSTPFAMVRKMVALGKLSVSPGQDRSLKIIKPQGQNLKRVYDRGFRAGAAAFVRNPTRDEKSS